MLVLNSVSEAVSHERMCCWSNRRNIYLLALFCCLMFSPDMVASQTTNLEQLQKCAAILGDSLLMSVAGNESRDICVRVVDHPASWIVDQTMIQLTEDRGFTMIPCHPPFPNDVLIAITNIGVRYVELDDPDFFRREVRFGLSASLPKEQERTKEIRRVTETREIVLQDTIEADQTSLVEASGYPFTVGTKIQRNRSGFWKKVVEPAVVIGSSVVMVILLFTTRSQ